jgi:hypothetical protein
MKPLAALWRRIEAWWSPIPESGRAGAGQAPAAEYPWRYVWDYLPKRSAGPDFSAEDYRLARRRAEDVARRTLGEAVWRQLAADGYLDVLSRRFPGITYRLRPGRRIEVLCAPGVRSPWKHPYLCVEPEYPLPDLEFLAHLYLYARDREDALVRVAVEQRRDEWLGGTFGEAIRHESSPQTPSTAAQGAKRGPGEWGPPNRGPGM